MLPLRTLRLALLCPAVLLLLALGTGRAHAQEKVGPWHFNLKLGPALTVNPAGGALGAFEFDLGYAITPDRNAIIFFAPQVQVVSAPLAFFFFPLGFQYDISMGRYIRGLYLYPSLAVGYALLVITEQGPFGGATGHAGVITPGFGVKYVWNGRYNFGFEPFSLPIIFGQGGGAFVEYRLTFYAGINF